MCARVCVFIFKDRRNAKIYAVLEIRNQPFVLNFFSETSVARVILFFGKIDSETKYGDLFLRADETRKRGESDLPSAEIDLREPIQRSSG